MSTKLETHAPTVRCHVCGAPEPRVVCHHCGRALCDDHSMALLNSAGNPLSAEFTGLAVEKAGAPRHCDDCEHMVKGKLTRVLAVGAGVAALGILLLVLGASMLGVIALVGGVGTAAGAILLDRKRAAAAALSRPPMPVVPSVGDIEVHETLRGSLLMDQEGMYHSSVRPVEGELRIDMAIARPDWERLELYRKKFGLADNDRVEFCAGFAVLRGQVGLRFDDAQDHVDVIPVKADVNGHPFFTSATDRPAGQWSMTRTYGLHATEDVDKVPIWLTPSLVPEQDQRSLELELQWTEFGSEGKELEIDRIESLKVLVPTDWGNLESLQWDNPGSPSPDVTVGFAPDPDDPASTLRSIEFVASIGERQRAAGRLTFSMRFEREISSSDTIRGDFEISFKGTLSGLTGVSMFHPLGEQRQVPKPLVQTVVEADFQLSLNGIRYQDVRMVPDLKREDDLDRPETFHFDGVIPDHETVIDLTNELSNESYYVKRVIENPPRSGARANVVNRYWDIAGRRYDGVYPVDFHLVLTGEELHAGDIRAHAGNTTARISVQGAYTKPVRNGNGLEEEIIKVWKHLCDTTSTTLRRRSRATRSMDSGGPDLGRHSRENTPNGDGQAPRATAGPQPSHGGADRVEQLRKRRDDLDEAVIQGRISDDTYQRIVSDIERELRDLTGM